MGRHLLAGSTATAAAAAAASMAEHRFFRDADRQAVLKDFSVSDEVSSYAYFQEGLFSCLFSRKIEAGHAYFFR